MNKENSVEEPLGPSHNMDKEVLLGGETPALPGMAMMWRIVGRAVRRLGDSAGGRRVLVIAGRRVGSLIVHQRIFGIGKPAKPVTAPEVTRRWLKVLDRTGCSYEVHSVAENAVEIRMRACPVRLATKEACDAGMEADRTVVRELGGELEIGDTIGGGAKECRLRVVV